MELDKKKENFSPFAFMGQGGISDIYIYIKGKIEVKKPLPIEGSQRYVKN